MGGDEHRSRGAVVGQEVGQDLEGHEQGDRLLPGQAHRAVQSQRLGEAQTPGVEVGGVEVHEVPVQTAGQAGDPQRVDVPFKDGRGDAEVLGGRFDRDSGIVRDPSR